MDKELITPARLIRALDRCGEINACRKRYMYELSLDTWQFSHEDISGKVKGIWS